MDNFIEQLNKFLGKAALGAYAGGGKGVEPQRDGFIEYEYREDDFYYRDSYAGYIRSAGQEVVWYQGKPVWIQSYMGGMTPEHREDAEFAGETFSFLKKALSHGEKIESFQPRGERNFKDGDWKYQCEWTGDITEFKGGEKILYKGDTVFTHDFFGGLLKQQ